MAQSKTESCSRVKWSHDIISYWSQNLNQVRILHCQTLWYRQISYRRPENWFDIVSWWNRWFTPPVDFGGKGVKNLHLLLLLLLRLLLSLLGWFDSSIFSLPLINQHQLLPGLLSGQMTLHLSQSCHNSPPFSYTCMCTHMHTHTSRGALLNATDQHLLLMLPLTGQGSQTFPLLLFFFFL